MTELTTTHQEPTQEKSDFLSRPLLASLNLDWEKAIYITFILLAIITRFWALGDRVMSHDESLHTQFSYQYFRGDGFQHTPLMHGPFLFHITALTYWLLGVNDFTARVPVALLGIVLIILPYFLRSWLGRVGAIVTSFLFLISPYLMYYSRYIRHDIFAIVTSLLVFIAIWHYLDRKEEKYLWLFAGALSWLFTTKEVSFIYVAIFGSFLIIRLLPQLFTAAWMPKVRGKLTRPLLLVLAGLVLAGGAYAGRKVMTTASIQETTPQSTEPFAADPETDTAVTEPIPPATSGEKWLRWAMVLGVGVASFGLFLGASALRPYLDNYPEFDLIILFSTLLLPLVSPLLMVMVGWGPRDYAFNTCMVVGQESMNAGQLLLARLFSLSWWQCGLGSGLARVLFFVGISLVISVMVGLWWNPRRWLIAAVTFYTIFTILYTSVFTNPGGFLSGVSGSLGYWLEQQDVQRGSQPWFYYIFVTPFYEFMPLIFSTLGIWLYLKRERLSKVIGYWIMVSLLAWFSFSLVNWWFNQAIVPGQEPSRFPGLLVALFILLGSVLFWFLVRVRQIKAGYSLDESSLFRLFRWQVVCDFVPYMTWWLALTWVAYSYAGEKMPWLSTHFVIPMALLSGWYFNEKLRGFDVRRLFARESLLFLGVTIILVVAFFLASGPLVLGIVRLGDQQLQNLSRIGRVLGNLLVVAGVLYVWLKVRQQVSDGRLRSALWSLSLFAILALLTMRFAYMASFPNADYVREFMVYAHGAPAAKSIVLDQVEELSQRLYGDNSIRVAYGGSGVPWPFTWYMRQYPNAVYYGESPSASLQDSPIVLVGRSSWDQADSVLGSNYSYKTYTYLWWPMEDYRQINWQAILGDPHTPEGVTKRGLLNADVRQAIWDIWFYRDFEKYDQTFIKTHSDGQWPLRDELRLYIRQDVMAQLWDHGISPVSLEPVVEPFAEGQLPVSPSLVIHAPGFPGAGPGELLGPRDLAVAPNGTLFVLDSGNQRVQVFDPSGALMTSFGEAGTDAGEFNADGQGPWGIAADDEFVYVADTWNHRIQKFTHEGDFVAAFGQAGNIGQVTDQGLGLFFGPRDIVLLADGRMLVTDTGNHRVQIMDRDGNFLGQIGGANGLSGAGLGLFYEPVGMAIDHNGFLYVADTWNGRVQQFSPEFFPVNEWSLESWAGNFSVNNKPYIAADSAGRIYATDPENYRVLIFSATGDYLGKFGQFGTDINSFALVNGIFIDAADNIYVADAGNNRILKFPPIFAPAFFPEEPLIEEAPVEEQPVEDTPVEEGTTGEEEEPTGAADRPTATPSGETEGEATNTAVPTSTRTSPTPTDKPQASPTPTALN